MLDKDQLLYMVLAEKINGSWSVIGSISEIHKKKKTGSFVISYKIVN